MRFLILFFGIFFLGLNVCEGKDIITRSVPYYGQYYFDDIGAIEKYALNLRLVWLRAIRVNDKMST